MTSIRVWREELAPFVTNFFSFSFLLTSRVNADRATDQKYPAVILMIEEPSKPGSDLQKNFINKKIKSNLHPTYIQGDADQREIFLETLQLSLPLEFCVSVDGACSLTRVLRQAATNTKHDVSAPKI